ncbi:MAG: transglutaminase-like domain-containing protein [Candidatus Verstraetearchaeota archaeon]|nr:transglutaminase-like domain-containing protein [Candidatus Verstraetearchaeota archaeon]
MGLLPVLLAILIANGSGVAYSYNLTVRLENGASPLSLDDAYSPFSLLLNQNVFKNVSGQSVSIESVRLNGFEVPWSLEYDSDGNPLVTINSSGGLAPMQEATVELLFAIEIERDAPEINVDNIGRISDIPTELKEAYPLTGIWDLSKLGDPEALIQVADSIRGEEENVILIIKHLLEWFEANMVYASNNTSPQTVWETFIQRRGDCDDQSNLFVLFCRLYGIPAYAAIGPIYLPGQVEDEADQNMRFKTENVGWHGWAMVYLPLRGGGGTWIPVDLTYFRGAYAEGGHIKSKDYLQHITGAALYYRDTVVFIEYINYDHISEYASIRDVLVSSDCVWIEFHQMLPISQPSLFSSALYLALAIVAVASILLIAHSILRRRNRGGLPFEGEGQKAFCLVSSKL